MSIFIGSDNLSKDIYIHKLDMTNLMDNDDPPVEGEHLLVYAFSYENKPLIWSGDLNSVANLIKLITISFKQICFWEYDDNWGYDIEQFYFHIERDGSSMFRLVIYFLTNGEINTQTYYFGEHTNVVDTILSVEEFENELAELIN